MLPGLFQTIIPAASAPDMDRKRIPHELLGCREEFDSYVIYRRISMLVSKTLTLKHFHLAPENPLGVVPIAAMTAQILPLKPRFYP